MFTSRSAGRYNLRHWMKVIHPLFYTPILVYFPSDAAQNRPCQPEVLQTFHFSPICHALG